MRTLTLTHMLTHIHLNMYACTYTHIHMYTRAYTHTHTHTSTHRYAPLSSHPGHPQSAAQDAHTHVRACTTTTSTPSTSSTTSTTTTTGPLVPVPLHSSCPLTPAHRAPRTPGHPQAAARGAAVAGPEQRALPGGRAALQRDARKAARVPPRRLHAARAARRRHGAGVGGCGWRSVPLFCCVFVWRCV